MSIGIGRNGESEKSNQSTKQEVLTKSADEVRRSVFAPEVRSPCDDHAPRRYETRALRCNEFFNVFRINQWKQTSRFVVDSRLYKQSERNQRIISWGHNLYYFRGGGAKWFELAERVFENFLWGRTIIAFLVAGLATSTQQCFGLNGSSPDVLLVGHWQCSLHWNYPIMLINPRWRVRIVMCWAISGKAALSKCMKLRPSPSISAFAREGAVCPAPHLKSVSPILYLAGFCIHPILYLNNVPPLVVFAPPPAAKSWRRTFCQCSLAVGPTLETEHGLQAEALERFGCQWARCVLQRC